MSEITLLVILIIFLAIIIFTGRFFFLLDVKLVTKKSMALLGFDALTLNYSFEQIVYLYTLPSHIPIIKNATKQSLIIKYDYNFLAFQKLKGISIYIKDADQTIQLAYLPTSSLRFPALDLLLAEDKIDERLYLKISTYRLTHSKTLKEITNEIYQQIKNGSYEIR